MAVQKQTRVWNGMTVESFTDTNTGKIEIKTPPTTGAMGSVVEGVKLAESGKDGKWSVTESEYFRRQYNQSQKEQGKQPVSAEEFNKEFYSDGANKFNNDRAAVLNNKDNYDNEQEFKDKAAAHQKNGIPLVKNPKTQKENNSQGQQISSNEGKGNEFLQGLDFGTDVSVKHSTQNFRYPLGAIPDLGYDFVQFAAFEYDPGGLTDSGFAFGGRRETVTLPIMPSIEDTSMTSWGSDSMNFIQEAAADVAGNALNSVIQNGGDVGKILQETGANIGSVAQELLNKEELKPAILGYFAGQASQTNFLARAGGVVINPNLELLFKGPALRTFSFNFKLRPRDADEGDVCKNIIRSFKKNMNPRRKGGNIFLNTPSVFKISYFFNGEPHPSLNRIKMCALTSFRVGYTPDGSYMTYQDGQVTGYDISLQFSEVFPIYADDQDKPEATSGVGY